MGECAQVSQINGYRLLFKAVGMIPISHYFVGCLCVSLVFLYTFLEFHFVEDFLTGGSQVKLTYHSGSQLYHAVVSKCQLLHGRYFIFHFAWTIYELYIYECQLDNKCRWLFLTLKVKQLDKLVMCIEYNGSSCIKLIIVDQIIDPLPNITNHLVLNHYLIWSDLLTVLVLC